MSAPLTRTPSPTSTETSQTVRFSDSSHQLAASNTDDKVASATDQVLDSIEHSSSTESNENLLASVTTIDLKEIIASTPSEISSQNIPDSPASSPEGSPKTSPRSTPLASPKHTPQNSPRGNPDSEVAEKNEPNAHASPNNCTFLNASENSKNFQNPSEETPKTHNNAMVNAKGENNQAPSTRPRPLETTTHQLIASTPQSAENTNNSSPHEQPPLLHTKENSDSRHLVGAVLSLEEATELTLVKAFGDKQELSDKPLEQASTSTSPLLSDVETENSETPRKELNAEPLENTFLAPVTEIVNAVRDSLEIPRSQSPAETSTQTSPLEHSPTATEASREPSKTTVEELTAQLKERGEGLVKQTIKLEENLTELRFPTLNTGSTGHNVPLEGEPSNPSDHLLPRTAVEMQNETMSAQSTTNSTEQDSDDPSTKKTRTRSNTLARPQISPFLSKLETIKKTTPSSLEPVNPNSSEEAEAEPKTSPPEPIAVRKKINWEKVKQVAKIAAIITGVVFFVLGILALLTGLSIAFPGSVPLMAAALGMSVAATSGTLSALGGVGLFAGTALAVGAGALTYQQWQQMRQPAKT